MKIVFLSRYQDTIQRGAEIFVSELSKSLSEKNQVEILSGKDADNILKVISGNYDIVIPINGRFQSLKASLGRLVKGYKLVISGHSGIGRDDLWNLIFARPNLFIALTDRMYYWARGWGVGLNITKIPNGVDLDKFNPKGSKIDLDLKRPIILSVGALTWYKHHHKTIEALSIMEQGSLLIVGKGPELEKLEALAKKLIPGRYLIKSFPYSDLPSVYRSVDLFTLPSWDREAFGIVYLEAMASGLGVVAPSDQTRREIIGPAGILVDVDDPDKYAEALNQAISKKWQAISRHQAENFSWEKIADRYERNFKQLLEA